VVYPGLGRGAFGRVGRSALLRGDVAPPPGGDAHGTETACGRRAPGVARGVAGAAHREPRRRGGRLRALRRRGLGGAAPPRLSGAFGRTHGPARTRRQRRQPAASSAAKAPTSPPSARRCTSAEPTTTPSATRATRFAVAAEATPKPTATGSPEASRAPATSAATLSGRLSRAPVTPVTDTA